MKAPLGAFASAVAVAGCADSAATTPMPPDCERPEFEAIAFMAGTWDVQGQERVDGAFEEVNGRATVQGALDGCALIEEFTGSRAGAPLETVLLLVVTPENAVQQARLDSGHRQIALAEGYLAGDSIVLTARSGFSSTRGGGSQHTL